MAVYETNEGGSMETISDLSRMSETEVEIKGLSPSSLFDKAIYPDFSYKESGLGFTEQLYTARGSQGIGAYEDVTSKGIDLNDFH